MVTGAESALASLHEEGVRYIFGVPGTSELRLPHHLPQQSSLDYIVSLHESVAVGMADGYTRATSESLGIASLHATQGTLNAIGFIRVAHRDGVPVVSLSGAPGTGYAIYEPNHSLRTISSVMQSVTKWSWQAASVSDIPKAIHRAITVAHAAPPGPTHVSIPQDLLTAEGEVPVPSSAWRRLYVDPAPSSDAIDAVATALSNASRPIIFAGHSVGRAQAVSDLMSLAELLQIPVVSESVDRGPTIQAVSFPSSHPLHLGYFTISDARIVTALANADLVILLGAKATWTRVVGSWIQSANIIQIEPNAWELGKSHPVNIGILSDIRHAVNAIHQQVIHEGISPFNIDWLPEPNIQPSEEAIEAVSHEAVHPLLLVQALNSLLDKSTIVVDDSQSLGYFMKRGYEFTKSDTLYGSLAGHLGWGLPAALGVQMARPEERVVCLVSDGSFLLTVVC